MSFDCCKDERREQLARIAACKHSTLDRYGNPFEIAAFTVLTGKQQDTEKTYKQYVALLIRTFLVTNHEGFSDRLCIRSIARAFCIAPSGISGTKHLSNIGGRYTACIRLSRLHLVGLAAVAAAKPADPVEYLAVFLLRNNPNKKK